MYPIVCIFFVLFCSFLCTTNEGFCIVNHDFFGTDSKLTEQYPCCKTWNNTLSFHFETWIAQTRHIQATILSTVWISHKSYYIHIYLLSVHFSLLRVIVFLIFHFFVPVIEVGKVVTDELYIESFLFSRTVSYEVWFSTGVLWKRTGKWESLRVMEVYHLRICFRHARSSNPVILKEF